MEIQLSHLWVWVVCLLVCEITDFLSLLFLVRLIAAGCHFSLMRCLSSTFSSTYLHVLEKSSLSFSGSFYPSSSPFLCGCWKLFKDARGLNHFDIITWACLTQTNPKPIEKLTPLPQRLYKGKRSSCSSKTWPNSDCTPQHLRIIYVFLLFA